MCGINFEEGQEYLVYAFASSGALATNLCTRTAKLKDAEAEVSQLSKNHEVYTSSRDTSQEAQISPNFNSGDRTRPLALLNQALSQNKNHHLFRLSWQIGGVLSSFSQAGNEKGYATALYNRRSATLKFYSQRTTRANPEQLEVNSIIYSDVTEPMLEQLVVQARAHDDWLARHSFFDRLPQLGATATNLGNYTFANTGQLRWEQR